MPRRKDRLPVVLDTNVLIAFHLSTNLQSANSKVYRLWRNKRKLQLVVSEGTAAEYFAVLQRLGILEESFRRLRRRFDARPTITRSVWAHAQHRAAIPMITLYSPQQSPGKPSSS